MEEHQGGADPGGWLDRLVEATNRHDLDGLVECFAEDYRNETPAHPSRGFEGRAQVRRNWQEIFARVPDLRTEVLRRTAEGEAVWSEWEMRGRRLDGSPHLMRGVMIFGVRHGRAAWARFYLEPVTETGEDANEAVRRHVGVSGEGR